MAWRDLSASDMALRLISSGVSESGRIPSAAAASPISPERLRWSLIDILSDTSIKTVRRRFPVSVCVMVAVGSKRTATIRASASNRVRASEMRTHVGNPWRRQYRRTVSTMTATKAESTTALEIGRPQKSRSI